MNTRRAFLRRTAAGLGLAALADLLGRDLAAGEGPVLSTTHHPAKAKSVIFLFMAGGPSHVDLFDPKPKLRDLNMQPIPDSFVKGERFAFLKGVPRCLGSPFAFARHGKAGIELSEALPHLATVADDIAVVRSMTTSEFNHAPGQIALATGHPQAGRPSIGAWLGYGLGSAGTELPGYVVMLSGENAPDGGRTLWSNGFLPGRHQGVEFRAKGDPVLWLGDPAGVDRATRGEVVDAVCDLDRLRYETLADDAIATRIASYELAFRMQASVPELADLAREPKEVHALYGTSPGQASFANNCLLARRLVERGVRMVQLCHRGWDHHGSKASHSIDQGLARLCRETDRAAAALIIDLKRRGLFDSTLVVWAGEFGRTPMIEARGGNTKIMGRDHHGRGFSLWLAGAGIKRGVCVGATDEFGYNAVTDRFDLHDLHATILHLLGIDHTRLTFRFQGRDYRLTDVHGRLMRPILA